MKSDRIQLQLFEMQIRRRLPVGVLSYQQLCLGSSPGYPPVNVYITMENHNLGKSTISMAIFNSYVSLPEGKQCLTIPSRMLCIATLLSLKSDQPLHCSLTEACTLVRGEVVDKTPVCILSRGSALHSLRPIIFEISLTLDLQAL